MMAVTCLDSFMAAWSMIEGQWNEIKFYLAAVAIGRSPPADQIMDIISALEVKWKMADTAFLNGPHGVRKNRFGLATLVLLRIPVLQIAKGVFGLKTGDATCLNCSF